MNIKWTINCPVTQDNKTSEVTIVIPTYNLVVILPAVIKAIQKQLLNLWRQISGQRGLYMWSLLI